MRIRNSLSLRATSFLFLLCFFWNYQNGISQTLPSREDSLVTILKSTLDDSMRVVVLNKLFKITLNNNPAAAEKWELQALAVAEKSGQPGLIGMINNNLGVAFSRRGKYDTALTYYEKAKENYLKAGGKWIEDSYSSLNNIGTTYYKMGRYEEALGMFKDYLEKETRLKDTVGIFKALNNIGSALKEQGKYSDAVENYLQSLALMQAQNDSIEIARIFINLGNIYKDQGMLVETYKNFKNALEIYENAGNKYELCGALSVMGDYYIEVDSLEKAKMFHQRCLELAKEVDDAFHIASSKMGLGQISELQGRMSDAELFFTEALASFREIGRVQSTAEVLNFLGNLHLELGLFNRAISEFEEALKLSGDIRTPDAENRALKGLANAWHGSGNDAKAFEFMQRHLVLNDSLFSLEKHRKIVGMQSRHLAAENQKQIDQLTLKNVKSELENTRNRNTIFFLFFGIILVLLVAGGFFILLRLRMRYAREIEKRNKEIFHSNEMLEERVRERTQSLLEVNKELDTFLYEAAHALRRPVQRIRGLSNLIVNEKDPKATAQLWDMVDLTLDSADKMLGNLILLNEIASRNPVTEPIRIKVMLDEIFNSHFHQGISLRLDFDPGLIFHSDSFLLKTILAQVIENAIVFKKQGTPDAEIKIIARNTGNGNSICVRDNGIGIPPEALPKVFQMFLKGSIASNGQGLGLYIAKKASDKIGATIQVSSKEGEYTEVILDF